MLNILTKSVYVLLTILTIIVVIPGFVTVVGFAFAVISNSVFGVDNSEIVIKVVNYIWRLYGIIQ
jgi:hypothetical protein